MLYSEYLEVIHEVKKKRKKKHLNIIQRPKLSRNTQFAAVADIYMVKSKMKFR